MLKSRYLLLLSAFFISTFAIPTFGGPNPANLEGIANGTSKSSDDCSDKDILCLGGVTNRKKYACNPVYWDYGTFKIEANTYLQTLSGARHKCIVTTWEDRWGDDEGTSWCANSPLKTNDISGAEYCLIQDGQKYECRTVGQSYTDSARSNACLNGACTTGYYQDGQTCKPIKPNETLCKSSDTNATESKYNQNNKCVPTKCKNTHYLENDKCTPITPNSTECKNHNIEHATNVVYDTEYKCKVTACEQNYMPNDTSTQCILKTGTQCSADDLKKKNAKSGTYRKVGNDIQCFATECRDGAYLVKKDNIEQGYCRTPKCAEGQEANIIDEKYIDINNQCKNKTADPADKGQEQDEEEDAENTILSSVTGKILDNTTDELISGAQITITGTNILTSSTEGAFTLSNVPKDAQLEISHTGYNTTTIKPTDDGIMVIKLTKAGDDTNNDDESQNVNYDEITGLILEEGNNAPIADANIKIGNTHTTITDASGNFTLSNVPSNAMLEITHQEYETINNLKARENMEKIHLTRKARTNDPANNNTPAPENGTDCTDQSLNSTTATYQNGKCVATACNDGYYLTDGNCADINGSPCDNLPTNATAGKREYDAATKETTCIVTACDKYYIVSDDKKSCEKDPEQEIQELKDKAQAAKDKEQSTENKLLGAVGIGATGIGGMQLASALAEQSADADALTDMTAYLETFKCTYGNNASVSGGTTNIETPGGNSLLSLYTEYVSLANDLKLRKNMLEMPAGIESEAILSSANGNLYNNDATDKTTGAYASLARALSDPTGADAQKLAQQQTETADKLKTGAIVAGVGAIGSLAGNLIINKDKYFDKDGDYKSVCDYETDSHTNCITYFNNTPLSTKDKDIMSALSIAYLKKVKGHDATCDKSDIHSTNKRAYIKCASTDGNYDWELKFTINDSLKSADQKKNLFSTVCKIYTGSNASGNTCNANETQCNEITNTMSAMDYTTTYNSDKCELK